jgi:hypothetical protein
LTEWNGAGEIQRMTLPGWELSVGARDRYSHRGSWGWWNFGNVLTTSSCQPVRRPNMDASRQLKAYYTLKYMYLCAEINKNCLISADLELMSRPGLVSHRAGSRDKRRRASLESELTEPRQAAPGPVKTDVGQSPKESVTRGYKATRIRLILTQPRQGCKKIYCIKRCDQITRESDEIVRNHCCQHKSRQWQRRPNSRTTCVPRQSCTRYACGPTRLDQPRRYKAHTQRCNAMSIAHLCCHCIPAKRIASINARNILCSIEKALELWGT